MEKIEYEGQYYYFNKGAIYDETFIEVPFVLASKITDEYFKKFDYKNMSENSLINFIRDLKSAEKFSFCIDVINFGLQKFCASKDFYRLVFPMITSCYRSLGYPQKAIDFWMENKDLYSSFLSTPLLTSLAAAYCDVGDFKLAKYCADKAYAIQGGGQNYRTELSLVYDRIKRNTERPEKY